MSSTASHAAAAIIAIESRSCGRFCISETKPLPSSPSRFSLGTTTSSKNSSEVSCACIPTLCEVAAALEARHARARRRAG